VGLVSRVQVMAVKVYHARKSATLFCYINGFQGKSGKKENKRGSTAGEMDKKEEEGRRERKKHQQKPVSRRHAWHADYPVINMRTSRQPSVTQSPFQTCSELLKGYSLIDGPFYAALLCRGTPRLSAVHWRLSHCTRLSHLLSSHF
jgi:hypothetical protein